MNKLVKVTDIIDFGSQKGEQFFWIYRLHISYLEWLIENTEYCFTDLKNFYNHGKIKRLKDILSDEKKDLIFNEVKLNNKPLNDSDNAWLMNVQNFDNLIRKDYLTKKDFEDVEYQFSDFHIKKNAEKLVYSKPYVSEKGLIEKVYLHDFFYEEIK